jgi:hypothetical protein
MMGIEPTNGGTTIHCLNHLATLALRLFIIALFSQKDQVFDSKTKKFFSGKLTLNSNGHRKLMKNWNIAQSLGTAIVTGILVSLAVSNPSQSEYEDYATVQLTEYLQKNVCPQAPKIWGKSLKRECKRLVDSNQSEIKDLISQTTERYNFILFSIYKTELSITKVSPFLPSDLLPSYHFGTLAFGQKFYIYQAEQK